MFTVYKIDDELCHPVEVQCEHVGYPHLDSQGDKMFENTHFATLAQAWQQMLTNAEARVELSADRVLEVQRALEKAQSELLESSLQLHTIKKGFAQSLEAKE